LSKPMGGILLADVVYQPYRVIYAVLPVSTGVLSF